MALRWSTVQQLHAKGLFKAGNTVLDVGSSNIYSADAASVHAFIHDFDPAAAGNAGVFAEDFARRSVDQLAGQTTNRAFLGEVLVQAGMGYRSVDIADGFRTTLIDLNSGEVPSSFFGAFDLVMNVGTTEHILNQANCFKFIHGATREGGLMFHQLPTSGFSNHGYFCYTPKFFCDLAGYNKYEIADFWFDGPAAHENLYAAVRAYAAIHPALTRTLERIRESEKERTIENVLVPDMAIQVLMRRTTSERFLGALETSTSVGPLLPGLHRAYSSRRVRFGAAGTALANLTRRMRR